MMTDLGKTPGFLMSVWMVGNMTAPPKQKRMVPNDTKNDLKNIKPLIRKKTLYRLLLKRCELLEGDIFGRR